MTWYKTGTVAVTNGSATVTGTGTSFISNVQTGDGFTLLADDRIYEIQDVVSNTELTLASNFDGATQTGQSYMIIPTRGVAQDAVEALQAAVTTMNTFINGALSGVFPAGTEAIPGLRFDNDPDSGLRRVSSNRTALVVGGSDVLTVAPSGIEAPAYGGDGVQANALDTTAGRLMAVGAFGLGQDAGPLIADIDALTTSGFYQGYAGLHGSATPGNNPFPNDGGAFGLISMNAAIGASDAYRVQIATLFSAADFQMKIRSRSTSDWGDWTLVHNNMTAVGTVSVDGSNNPNGAIVESGSNANGSYTRFADGTQICYHTMTATVAIDTALMGGFRSDAQTWTYPMPFSVAPTGLSGELVAVTDGFGVNMTAGGTTQNNFVWVAITSQASAARSARLMAIGRWR